jgi:hypothetical protein
MNLTKEAERKIGMSRGPGKWQRKILQVLQERWYVSEYDLFSGSPGRTERLLFRRAAERLAAKGLVTVKRDAMDRISVTRLEN